MLIKNGGRITKRLSAIRDKERLAIGIISISAIAVLLLKFYVIFNTYGTNDIMFFEKFAKIITKTNTVEIYHEIDYYNHSPFIGVVLKLYYMSGLPFSYLFRIPSAICDFLSVFLIYQLLAECSLKRRFLSCMALVFSPLIFFISGFHGNTDGILTFLVLLSVYFLQKKRIVAGAIALGFGMIIKIVPVLLVMGFFFLLKNHKDRIKFFSLVGLIPFFTFSPYLVKDPSVIIKNVFLYSSLWGHWGITRIHSYLISSGIVRFNADILWFLIKYFPDIYSILIFIFVPILLLFIFRRLLKVDKLNATRIVYISFGIFLVFTPGFGIQYLIWLAPFAIMEEPIWGGIFNLVGGIFVYRVYSFWSGGGFPNYANSLIYEGWVGLEIFLEILTWLILLVMVSVSVVRLTRISPKINESQEVT